MHMEAFLKARIAACQERKAALLADGREDEAVFEQVRGNVYEIFLTVWKLGKGTQFFREKLTTIPMSWHAAAMKAKCHDDAAAVMLETIKLETVQEIRAALEERT